MLSCGHPDDLLAVYPDAIVEHYPAPWNPAAHMPQESKADI
jgi:hypothetical protein